jgi:ABC-2 type transport system permease protein
VVWLRSIFLKTLRDCRVPILGWGLGIGALPPLIFVAIPTLLSDEAGRAGVLALARNPAVRLLLGDPVDVLNPGGYATWRLSLILPLVSVWALLTVSRTLRGAEEAGSLDVLLSAPRSRLRVAMEILAAVATALLLIGGLISLMAFAGARVANVDLGLNAALLFGLNTVLLAGVFGAAAMLISQFTRARVAAGVTGALLGLSVVMSSAGRTVPNGEWIGRLSPLYYFELSKPLIPTYGANPRAMYGMTVLAAAMSAFGVALFVRRDVGAPVTLPLGRRRSVRQAPPVATLPLGAWSLRSVFARSLTSLGAATLWWGLAIAVYAALLTAILRQAEQNLLELLEAFSKRGPMYGELLSKLTRGGDVTINASFLSLIFTMLAAVVATFAVTLANRWAAEEEAGRLELLLGTPQPRPSVILARFAAVAVALMAVAGLIFGSVVLTAAAVGMTLDRSRLAQAAFGMVPVGLVVAAVGYLLSGWLRTAAVTGTLVALLLASFVITLLAPLFRWPDLVLQFSIFEQYGAPLVQGLPVANTLRLLAVTAVALAIATVRFARKDVAR